MSSINGEHLFVNANAFRDWAKEQVDNKHEDTALALTKTGVDGAQEARKILQADVTDSSKSVEHLMENNVGGTKEQRKLANAEARKIFLSFIKQSCGLKDNASLDQLPENVRRAMKLTGIFHKNDWFEGSSRPLTARRINAVMEALDNFREEAMHGMAFHPTSKFGKYYKSQWNFEPSGDIIALLNNVPPKMLEKMAKPLAMLGTNVSKRQVVLVLSKQELIQELIDKKKLTPKMLFYAMYGKPGFMKENLEYPKDLQKAEKKGDKKAVAEAFEEYNKKEFKDAEELIRNDKKKTPEEKEKLLVKLRYASQLSSHNPVSIAKGLLDGEQYDEKGDVRMNTFNAPVTSTRGDASLAIGTIGRQVSGSNEMSITFLDKSKGKQVVHHMCFKGVKDGETSQNGDASKALENQVNEFCKDGNYNKGLLYSALKSDDGINRLVRQIGHAKTGDLRLQGVEGGNYTVEKMTNGVLKLTLANRKNTRLNCEKISNAEKNNKYDSFNVDYRVQILLYPDGRQNVIEKHSNYTAIDTSEQNGSLPRVSVGDPIVLPEDVTPQVYKLSAS